MPPSLRRHPWCGKGWTGTTGPVGVEESKKRKNFFHYVDVKGSLFETVRSGTVETNIRYPYG